MIDAARIVAINIPVGDHVTRKIGGLTFNIDTIWTTAIAGNSGPRIFHFR